MNDHVTFPIAKFEPSRNDPCLCGSGKKFKKCCMGAYTAAVEERAFGKYNKGLYDQALVTCRHHLTWYLLCHKAHTAPFLASKTKEAAELLHIDIEALAELLDLLHHCYYRTGQSEQFPSVLMRLVNSIDDPRWRDKIAYQHSLWWLLDKEDRNTALSTVSKVDIAKCKDPEILALYLDVCLDSLPFSEIAGILDRILSNTDKQSYKLQYSVLKGIAYALINDMEHGCKIIRTAIDKYEALKEKDKSPYGDYLLAHALELLGQLTNDSNVVGEAAVRYGQILKDAEMQGYSVTYLAEIMKCIGDCKAFLGQYGEAIRYYKDSLAHEEAEKTKVFLARAYANAGEIDLARHVLKSIDPTKFDDSYHYDYATSWTVLATHSLRAEDIEVAKVQLKQAKAHWPLFIAHRDSALIQLLEITPKTSAGKLGSLIHILNRYVSLNPNFFGIGINFNRIIEDIGRTEEK